MATGMKKKITGMNKNASASASIGAKIGGFFFKIFGGKSKEEKVQEAKDLRQQTKADDATVQLRLVL